MCHEVHVRSYIAEHVSLPSLLSFLYTTSPNYASSVRMTLYSPSSGHSDPSLEPAAGTLYSLATNENQYNGKFTITTK